MWSTWRNYSQILSYTGTDKVRQLDKEEMYVEYLEKLLSDIELHMYSKQGVFIHRSTASRKDVM
jgi:hypothetical protein